MIQIVMKPTPGSGIVNKETLYTCLFNGEDVGLRVRGLKAAHAEEKMMIIFREQLKGKTVSYDLEAYKEAHGEAKAENAGEETVPKDDFLPGLENA